MNQLELLKGQIEENRKKLSTDGYKISIGELNSMYKEKELIIDPDYQRYFRWSLNQKSRFIESILLGIPVPPIFVSQGEDGKWEVIDGLQRLSTLLQFTGSLFNSEGQKYEKLVLGETKLLPALEGVTWEKMVGEGHTYELPQDLKLFIKRASINVEIIKQESDPSSKYEMFQRLNTLGTALSDQEVRNCLLIMINRKVFSWLEELSRYQNYLDSISITERNLEERYEIELVLRALTLTYSIFEDGWKKKDVSDILTDAMVKIADSKSINYSQVKQNFNDSFDLICDSLGDKAFKKYNFQRSRFEGPFLVSAFECISVGVISNIDAIKSDSNYDIEEKIKSLWGNTDFTSNVSRGTRAPSRMDALIPVGKDHFRP